MTKSLVLLERCNDIRISEKGNNTAHNIKGCEGWEQKGTTRRKKKQQKLKMFSSGWLDEKRETQKPGKCVLYIGLLAQGAGRQQREARL